MQKPFDITDHRHRIERAMQKKTFCTLATSSASGRPHTVGVRYVMIDGAFYINVHEGSIKVRNLRENPHAALCIPAQKVPLFPDFCIQFQGTADVLPASDSEIQRLAAAGQFKPIVSEKHLREPGMAFIRITPGTRMHSYGIGEKLLDIVRAPYEAGRSIAW